MLSACCAIPHWRTTTRRPGPSGSPRGTAPHGRRPQATGFPMQRGEIRLVDLEPVRGSEASKRRPGVIVSNDRANSVAARLGRGVVTVVPVTSNIRHVFPFQTLLPSASTGLRVDSKAQAEQVRSVAVERIGPVLGRLPADLLLALDDALRLHVGL